MFGVREGDGGATQSTIQIYFASLRTRNATTHGSEGLVSLDKSLSSLPTTELVDKIRRLVCQLNAEPVEIVRSADLYKSLLQDQTLTMNTHIKTRRFKL